MNDRELLEYAAKAAGVKWPQNVTSFQAQYEGTKEWNPLKDDGDAFRLAVKLDLIIEPPRDDGYCHVYHYWRNLQISERRHTMKDDAEQAATRRAIVRAAAEIGKAMEKNNG